MAILIQRKPNTNLTWEANALFKASFPRGENVFEIPNINYMTYLYKSFDLIEATDKDGNELDLTSIRSCCGDSIKLDVVPKMDKLITSTVHETLNDLGVSDKVVNDELEN